MSFPLSSLSWIAENRIFCFFASLENSLYCSGDIGNWRRSRVSRSIFPRLIFPEMVLLFFASAMDSASTFLRAEPPSRTLTSPNESIMRTS